MAIIKTNLISKSGSMNDILLSHTRYVISRFIEEQWWLYCDVVWWAKFSEKDYHYDLRGRSFSINWKVISHLKIIRGWQKPKDIEIKEGEIFLLLRKFLNSRTARPANNDRISIGSATEEGVRRTVLSACEKLWRKTLWRICQKWLISSISTPPIMDRFWNNPEAPTLAKNCGNK